MLEKLTHDSFAAELGSEFRLPIEGGAPLVLALAEATLLGSARPGGSRAPFSLVFRGPHGPVLPQRIYRLEHDRLGAAGDLHRPDRPGRGRDALRGDLHLSEPHRPPGLHSIR